MRIKVLEKIMCKGSNEVILHNDFNAGLFEASLMADGNSQNFVASPLSVLVLFSSLLLAKGPRGETAKEVCDALVGREGRNKCSHQDYERVDNLLKKIRKSMETVGENDGKKVFTLSNAIFMAKSLQANRQFMEEFTMFRGDKVEQVEFNTSMAVDEINRWADSSTDGLVKQFFKSRDELTSDTLMVLLNAIAFQDNWGKTFNSESTMPGDFFLNKNEKIQVPMMHTEEEMTYLEKSHYRVVAKTFKNERYKFVILLPKERFDLSEIEDDLRDGDFKWNDLNVLENSEQIKLVLPKFKVEHELPLKPLLNLLGIRRLFSRGAADLRGIMDGVPLYVSDAKQVAVMEVDENGVRASAVTGMSIMPMSLPPPPTLFDVDQPFYCAIYDTELDMPLFIARIVDPR